MARPPMAVGTHGKITTVRVREGGSWHARTLFRDYDGVRREIARWGRTKPEAERLLAEAIRDRATPTTDAITSNTKLADLAEQWSAQLDDADLSDGSRELYRGTLERHLVPALGELRLRELSVQTLDRCLITIRKQSGHGAAKSSRSVLSGLLGYAVRYGALSSNLARDTSPITRKTMKAIRALTVEETARLMGLLAASTRADDLDLPDLVTWMLGTGMRIGEACAVRDDVIRGNQLEVNATVKRLTGQGLVIQMRPKTDAGHRILTLAPHLLDLRDRRAADETRATGPQGVLFASARGRLRDPNNTSGDLREVLDGLECDECAGTGYEVGDDGRVALNDAGRPTRCDAGPWSWVTSHVFRKTVATRLDEAGFTPREVADILGHEKPSMTQDVYMGRKVVSSRMAVALGEVAFSH